MTGRLVLDFRPSRPDDKAAIVSLLAQDRGADFAHVKSALFDWQFDRNPAAQGDAPFLLATEGDAVVAAVATTPVRLDLHGQGHVSAWMVDFYVARDHRGRGLGTSLIVESTGRAPVVLAFGISDMSDPLFEGLGWPLEGSLATMFRHCAEIGLRGRAKNLAGRLLRLAGARRGRCAGYEFSVEASLSARPIDAFGAASRASTAMRFAATAPTYDGATPTRRSTSIGGSLHIGTVSFAPS